MIQHRGKAVINFTISLAHDQESQGHHILVQYTARIKERKRKKAAFMPMHLLKLSDGSRMEGDVGFLPSTPRNLPLLGP